MRKFLAFGSLTFIFIIASSFTTLQNLEDYSRLSERYCSTAFGGDIEINNIKDNSIEVGHSIWISRKSRKVHAKYFAYKQNGEVVNDRYSDWKQNKQIVLMSSGTYAAGWDGTDKPVGVTVDNGNIVNRNYDSRMDGLVIVYATGGIVVSNIEDGDLYLDALGKRVDIRKSYDRSQFLKWAQDEEATVFQTHLTIFKNELQFKTDRNQVYSKQPKKAKRKFLILARDDDGELFHIVYYFKKKDYTMYEASAKTLAYLKSRDMNVIAAINLDTGGYDILSTGKGIKDCNGNYLKGTKNHERDNMTNMLTYWSE